MVMYGVSGAGPKRLAARFVRTVRGGGEPRRPQEAPDRRHRGQREPRDERGRSRPDRGLSLGASPPLPDDHGLTEDGGAVELVRPCQESSERGGLKSLLEVISLQV